MEDLARLNTGEKVAGVSAMLLFVFMFFNWFGAKISGPGGSIDLGSAAGGSAWDSLDQISIFLLVTVVLVLAATSLRLSHFDYEPPVALNAALAAFGGVSTLLILYRIISPPSFGDVEGISVDATLKLGIFLGLVAAAGIGLGSFRAMREEKRAMEPAALPGNAPPHN